jgi:hypothetical protein
MERSKLLVTALLLLAVVGAGTASAQERRLKKSDLPAAVQRTVDEQSRGATIRGYGSETEDGKLQYEVEMTVNGHSRDVLIAPDGTLLEIEEQVTIDSLPAAVREGLKQQAGAGSITNVESITKHGTLVAYEAHVRTGTKRSEVQVGPDGKPLAHPE